MGEAAAQRKGSPTLLEQGQCLMPTGNVGDPMWEREGKPDASSPPLLISCSYTSRKTQNRQASGQPELLLTNRESCPPAPYQKQPQPNKSKKIDTTKESVAAGGSRPPLKQT